MIFTGESLKCYYCAENTSLFKSFQGYKSLPIQQEIVECNILLEQKFNQTCDVECGKLIIDVGKKTNKYF